MMTDPPPHDVPITPVDDQVTTDLTLQYGDIAVQVVIKRPPGTATSQVLDAVRGAQRSTEVWLTRGVMGDRVSVAGEPDA